jgi:squalene cyclase
MMTRTRTAGLRYVLLKIDNDQFGLRCLTSDKSWCPLDGRGHLFAAFFISEALAPLLPDSARAAILARIDREQQFGAWGYCTDAPIDADDTAFALRTAHNFGRNIRTEPLDVFFRNGLYTTFEQGARAKSPLLAFDVSLANNFMVHPEVLANVYSALTAAGFATCIDDSLILASQAPEGYFRSYFYPSPYYGTWMTLNLLKRLGRLLDARAKALHFLYESQNSDGSWGTPGNAYESALALDACGIGLSVSSLRKATTFLLESQTTDGSWYSAIPIWAFRYTEDPIVSWNAYDSNRVVTSALVLKALFGLGQR